MKLFSIEFTCFPGLEVNCNLCGEPIKERQEEVIVPTLYMNKQYEGAICIRCYCELPLKINASRLPKFDG